MADLYEQLGVPHWRGRISKQHLYSVMGFSDNSPHPMNQMELPGMESLQSARKSGLMDAQPAKGVEQRDTLPDTADIGLPLKGMQSRLADYSKARGVETPTHVRWEDMHPDDQADVLEKAAAYGVDYSTLKQRFGDQVDAGYIKASRAGASVPAGSDFYGGRAETTASYNADPRSEIAAAAKRQGVHFQTMVDSVALGSPRMAFHDPEKGDMPNVVGAEEYTRRGMAGDEDPTATSVMRPGVKTKAGEDAKVAMLPARGRLIAHAAPQLESGVLSSEVTTRKGGKMFGAPGQEKISAFGPAFKDPHGSKAFLTSDVHTGKGMTGLTGDEFDSYMSIPGIHQLHDAAARAALAERGLPGVHSGQGTQWQVQREDAGESTEHALYSGASQKHPFFPEQDVRSKAASHQFDKLF